MEMTKIVHLAMLVFAVVCILAGIQTGKIFDRRGIGRLYNRTLSAAVLLWWVCYNIYYFVPQNFSWPVSLPLHICDIAALIAAIAVLNPKRPIRAILYYWSFTFTIQAFIFPVGDQDPGTLRFWFFWILHISIMNCAVYDLAVRNFRPGFRDLSTSIVWMAIYLVVILPANYYFGWNYGYIGDAFPDVDTPMHVFGSWPVRILWLFLIAIFVQFIITLPWLRRFRRKRRVTDSS